LFCLYKTWNSYCMTSTQLILLYCITKCGYIFWQIIWSSSGHSCTQNQNYNCKLWLKYVLVLQFRNFVFAIVILVLFAQVAWGWHYNWLKHVATFYNVIWYDILYNKLCRLYTITVSWRGKCLVLACIKPQVIQFIY